MHITINRDDLLPLLQVVMGAVEKRQSMPILGNVLFCVSSDLLSITATDLEVEMQVSYKLDSQYVAHEGTTTIPAKKLLDIVRALPAKSLVELKLEDLKLHIHSGKSRFKLSTLEACDFPNVEEGAAITEFSLPQADFKFLLERVYFSMAQQDIRYYLNGVLLEKSSTGLTVVATDGHRLALCESTQDFSDSEKVQCIIPRKAILELLRTLKTDDSLIQIALGDNHIKVVGEGYIFISKLIDGSYPDYNAVIPKKAEKKIVIQRNELKDIFSRISILANEKYHGIKLILSTNSLQIQAHNSENEEANEEIEVSYQGESVDVGFNVGYLLDALNAFPDTTVVISFSNYDNSVILEEEHQPNCLYIVMPMRL